MIKKTLLAGAALAFMAAGFAQPAAASGFPEKDIIFIIPFSPGGGMDSTARQLARVMSKYLPHKVNVVPKNVPGAGGKKGYGQLVRAKADGYTISVINMPGAAVPQLSGQKVSYDITKIVWVGRMSTSPYLLGVSAKSSIKSFKQIQNLGRALKFAHTGFGSTAFHASKIIKLAGGFEATHLTGYKGSKSYIVAIIRGDAEAAMAPTQTFAKFVQSGDIRGIVTFEEKSSFPGVPTIAEVGLPNLTGLGVERMVGAPPGTPADIIKILSDALGKAAADPESLAWAKKTKRPFGHLTASQTQAAVDRALANFAKYPGALEK